MPELLWNRYKDRKVLETYCHFYYGYRRKLAFAILLFFVKSTPVYFIPIITADIINLLTNENAAFRHELLGLLTIGLVLIVQNIPTHIWYARVFSRVSRQVEENLRTALCARLQHLSMHYHTSNKMGVIQTKVLRDVENIESLTRLLVEGFPGLIATFSIAVAVTIIRAPIFVFFYLFLVPPAVLLYRIIRRAMIERNNEFRVSMENMTGQVNEMLRLIPVTRAHHLEDSEMERINARLEQIRVKGSRMDSVIAVFGSMNWTLMMCFNLITLCTAAYLKYAGMLPVGIGDIVLLSTYFSQITGCVMQLLGFFPAIAKGMESVRSVGEILECPDIEQNEGMTNVTSVTGTFQFENVSFRYEGAGQDALKSFNLNVKQGETIALVGASGAGKTTVAQLVIGFIRPTSGRILLDGVDMNTLDLRTYRQFISVVTQETILFDGTIRDNIAYGIKHPSDAEILRVIKDANLDTFLSSLPEGLGTRVCENGARLSGGQRQRIAIARALIRNPKVLILDEATSALDVDSEAEIKESFDRLMVGRTTFVVAHRLSTIQNADRIVVMDNGGILELGSHTELLAKNGRYAAMYQKFIHQN